MKALRETYTMTEIIIRQPNPGLFSQAGGRPKGSVRHDEA